jgi:hypothetical protein
MELIDKFLSIVLLKDRGINSYEDLTKAEKEVYEQKKKEIKESLEEMTIPKLEGFIKDLKEVLKKELLKCENPREKDLFLKARLNNLEDILGIINLPETIKKSMEGQIKGRE